MAGSRRNSSSGCNTYRELRQLRPRAGRRRIGRNHFARVRTIWAEGFVVGPVWHGERVAHAIEICGPFSATSASGPSLTRVLVLVPLAYCLTGGPSCLDAGTARPRGNGPATRARSRSPEAGPGARAPCSQGGVRRSARICLPRRTRVPKRRRRRRQRGWPGSQPQDGTPLTRAIPRPR